MMKSDMATVIVTGVSSGVGIYATTAHVARGWRVVMARRDVAKAAAVGLGFATSSIAPSGTMLKRMACSPAISCRIFHDSGGR